MAVTLAASAQGRQASAAETGALPAPAMRASLVKTGLYLIEGGGSNSLLRFSASGLILVDGKSPGNYRPLMSQVRKIARTSDLPLRVLVVAGHHPEHTGTDAQFAAAAIPIVAQDNVRKNLLASAAFDATPTLPSFTYERDYTLRLGGVQAHLLHLGNACTDGDTVVHFPDLKVVAVGDLFSATGSPAPDFGAGGSLVHWGNVLAQVLELDFDTVIASTGAPATRADLQAFKSKIDALVSRATLLARQGVPKDQLMGRLQTDDLGWRLDFSEAQVAGFYAELTAASE